MPTQPNTRRRNLAAMSPLLHKGGVHQKSKSGQRATDKQQLNADLVDWREKLDENSFTINPSWSDSGKESIF